MIDRTFKGWMKARLRSRVQIVEGPLDTDCWLFTGAQNLQGYGQIKHKQLQIGAHRFSWEAYKGPIPEGMCVLHACDVKPCCNPDHLFLGTNWDNTQDAIAKGLYRVVGEDNPSAKLTEAQVSQIKTMLNDGVSYKEIAMQFTISPSLVQTIKVEKIWYWVEPRITNLLPDWEPKLINCERCHREFMPTKRWQRFCSLKCKCGTTGESRAREQNPQAKLCNDDVGIIKRLLIVGWSKREVAIEFDVSLPTIHRISSGRSWRNVPPKPKSDIPAEFLLVTPSSPVSPPIWRRL